jgi:hypothetical protein
MRILGASNKMCGRIIHCIHQTHDRETKREKKIEMKKKKTKELDTPGSQQQDVWKDYSLHTSDTRQRD